MDTRAKTCCFTGHREMTPGELVLLPARLDGLILYLVGRGVSRFLAGGARGFDTLAAREVLRLRDERKLPVGLYLELPGSDQPRRYSKNDSDDYYDILLRADGYRYVTTGALTRETYLARDRRMVDESAFCVAYLNKKSGGTAYTCSYAKKSGLEIYNLGSETIV